MVHVRRVLFTIKMLHKCFELMCLLYLIYVLRRTYRQDYETFFHVVILSKHHHHHGKENGRIKREDNG
jgi:hypothetical protein